MDAKRKKMIFLFGSIFVAIIFLSSYAAFNNNNTKGTSTTTIKPPTTYFSIGSSNAVISNYSDIAYVKLLNNSNGSENTFTEIISRLVSNGSVLNYIYSNYSYEVVLSTISPYGLQQLLNANTMLNGTVAVGSTIYVTLPRSIILVPVGSGQAIPVSLNNRNYSVYTANVSAIGSTVNVSISALLERNGSVYNNQFRVSLGKTIKPPVTYLYTGNSSAIISNYGNIAYVTLLNNSNYSKSTLTNIISLLMSNGSVMNYKYTNNSYKVTLVKTSPYALMQLLGENATLNGLASVGSTAYVTLPNSIALYYGANSINLNLTNKNYTVYLKNVSAIGSTVNVSISALLTKNGSVYDNQFTANYKQ